MLHLNPCGTKDPRAGAAGAGAADAVEQPPQNEAEHGKMNDKGADEVQRDGDEQPRENRGDEEVKSEEKEEEGEKRRSRRQTPNMSNYLVPNPYPWAFLMFCQN